MKSRSPLWKRRYLQDSQIDASPEPRNRRSSRRADLPLTSMANERWNGELEVTAEHLRDGLAAAVLGIQWSYAIYWSPSPRQARMLEWGDGYYNGDIKTRKRNKSLEMEHDRMGLERSEHLRQLYVSLWAGSSDQLARRPSNLLSPEDLADSEWFYLLCMSFTFHPGHGLVGRTMASGTHTWLTDAHSAESQVFTRSLMAKSASIHTVFCCPFLYGVLELGTTESVREDPDLIRQVTTLFWESQKSISAERYTFNLQNSIPEGRTDQGFDPEFSSGFQPLSELNGGGDDGCNALAVEEPEEPSPISPAQLVQFNSDVSAMIDGLDDLSQSHSWRLLDDKLILSALRPVDCPKQDMPKTASDPTVCRRVYFSDSDAGVEDPRRYHRTLSAIFWSTRRARATPSFPGGSSTSSFVPWCEAANPASTRIGSQTQTLLKKILFNRPGAYKPSSKRNKETLNKNFRILRSLLPFTKKYPTQADKSSILADTIEYLKELEVRVKFLESQMKTPGPEMKELSKHPDSIERTPCNEGNNSSICKRKTSEADKPGFEADVNVTVVGKEITIQATCPWRDCLLIEVVDALSGLHLDALSVQSSTVGGNLSLSIKSKFREGVVESSGICIKEKIHRVLCKC